MSTLIGRHQLIADLQAVHVKNASGFTTRDYYQANGNFSKGQIRLFWPTFGDFLKEAGIINNQNAGNEQASSESNEYTADSWKATFLSKNRIETLEQLIEHCKVDVKVWEVERFTCNKWEMGYTVGSGNSKQASHIPLFQVKATFKKKTNVIAITNEINDLIAEAKKRAPDPKPITRARVTHGKMLEVNIPDVHFGKLAWGKETGYGNYDTSIAEDIHNRAVDNILARAKNTGHNFEEVVYVVGNDLLQADNTESQTTSGTIVTTDGRYQKTFKVARRSVIRAIEKLRTLAPVKVIVVPGNHDELSTWHLGESLEIYFSKYDDVTVDNDLPKFKYHQFGKVMLMLTHGHKAKRADYPMIMATKQPQMFAETTWRECHCGHTHQTKLDEKFGVRVRVLPALCEPDDWHAENGFVGNLRLAEAFVWDKEEGLLQILYYNDESYKN